MQLTMATKSSQFCSAVWSFWTLASRSVVFSRSPWSAAELRSVVASGTHEELMASCEAYQRIARTQLNA